MRLTKSLSYAALLSLGFAGVYAGEAKVYHCPTPQSIFDAGNRPATIANAEGVSFNLVKKPEFNTFNAGRGGQGTNNITYLRVMAANSDTQSQYEMTCHYQTGDQKEGVYMTVLPAEATGCGVVSKGAHDNNNNDTNTLCDTAETCAVECDN